MSKKQKDDDRVKMAMTIRGREVTLYFTAEPNPQIAMQVKQALLGTYLLTKEQPVSL